MQRAKPSHRHDTQRLGISAEPRCPADAGFYCHPVAAGESDPAVGTVCGKLLSMSADFQLPPRPSFDSTGVYFTPTLRHFDRGSGETDNGQYERCEYVFGATGAAALYRRTMIEDISIGGEFYDHDFFVYREDADVAWRAQLFGWTCLYVPFAQGYHVRRVKPANRRQLEPYINMHSVKNRFLLRIKNVTGALYLRRFIHHFVSGSCGDIRLPDSRIPLVEGVSGHCWDVASATCQTPSHHGGAPR